MSSKREDETRADGISPELDRLSAALMGDALDLLAAGEDVNVLLVASDAKDLIYLEQLPLFFKD